MDNTSYQEKSLAGATGVELVIALYDAAIRFLYRAMQCVEDKDVRGRRIAVKKTIDVLMYLQARLRPDLGPAPAKALSDFYGAMFTMILEASHAASKVRLEESIACIRNVREAWVVAARDPTVGKILPRELRTREEKYLTASRPEPYDGEAPVSRWSA
ncbi:MAG TPA: flagellar export chaperone FliS [Granulicella sp.]|nr:flagellar export chaperone FliS [Granulicella sp.]